MKSKVSAKTDAKVEFRCIMERLARDLKLHRISPQELIKIVLPSKAIKNERILETLMYQANSGETWVILDWQFQYQNVLHQECIESKTVTWKHAKSVCRSKTVAIVSLVSPLIADYKQRTIKRILSSKLMSFGSLWWVIIITAFHHDQPDRSCSWRHREREENWWEKLS